MSLKSKFNESQLLVFLFELFIYLCIIVFEYDNRMNPVAHHRI